MENPNGLVTGPDAPPSRLQAISCDVVFGSGSDCVANQPGDVVEACIGSGSAFGGAASCGAGGTGAGGRSSDSASCSAVSRSSTSGNLSERLVSLARTWLRSWMVTKDRQPNRRAMDSATEPKASQV